MVQWSLVMVLFQLYGYQWFSANDWVYQDDWYLDDLHDVLPLCCHHTALPEGGICVQRNEKIKWWWWSWRWLKYFFYWLVNQWSLLPNSVPFIFRRKETGLWNQAKVDVSYMIPVWKGFILLLDPGLRQQLSLWCTQCCQFVEWFSLEFILLLEVIFTTIQK